MLTLDESIHQGLNGNFSLSLSKDQSAEATALREGGVGRFLPSASAYLSRDGSLPSETSSTHLGATVNWLLFDGLQSYHSYHQLQSRELGAKLEERVALEGFLESLVVAYYDIVQQKQHLAAINDLLFVSERRGKLASAKLEVGSGSRLSQLQSVADLNQDSSRFLSQQESLHKAKIHLNQLMARDPSLDFDVVDSIPLLENLTLNDWQKILLENNATLSLARTQKKEALSGLGEARGHWWPSLNSSVGYSVAPKALNNTTSSRKGELSYSLNLSVPLFDKLATPTGVRLAKLAVHEQEIRLKQMELDVKVEFELARNQYETSLRQTALESRNLAVAKLQAEGAMEKYRVGSTTELEFRDAQTRLLDAEVRLILARQRAKQAEVALQRLVGLLVRSDFISAKGKK